MNLEKKLLFQIIGQRLARIPIRTQIIHLSISIVPENMSTIFFITDKYMHKYTYYTHATFVYTLFCMFVYHSIIEELK